MSKLTPPVGPSDHAQGPRDAKLVLVEFGDFECPYCGQAYPELKAVQEAMSDKLCFIFRHFPLSQAHPHAERAAEFSEAAATVGRFWEMHDLLYENQQLLEDADLIGYAESLGMSKTLITSTLNGEFSSKVRQNFTSGVRSGVNGTPCLFLNGELYQGDWDAQSVIATLRKVR